jgi:hypothetical protein
MQSLISEMAEYIDAESTRAETVASAVKNTATDVEGEKQNL